MRKPLIPTERQQQMARLIGLEITTLADLHDLGSPTVHLDIVGMIRENEVFSHPEDPDRFMELEECLDKIVRIIRENP